jgi:hypothetical protein
MVGICWNPTQKIDDVLDGLLGESHIISGDYEPLIINH